MNAEKSVLTAPRGLMLVNGHLVIRMVGVQHWTKPLVCYYKHTIEERPTLVQGVDIPRCAVCGMAVYIMSCHDGFQLRADLTPEEAREITGRSLGGGLRVGDVLKYVGAELDDRVA